MASQGTELLTREERSKNKDDGKEDIIKTIKEKTRNMDDINKLVTPKGLAEGTQNILETSLMVSFELKKASQQDGPNGKELGLLGDTVEYFACNLLTYSNNFSDIKKQGFRDCDINFTDAAIKYKAKKFLAGPTTQYILRQLWTQNYWQENSTSPHWILANVLTLFEVFLFPVVFLPLFTYHKIDEKRGKRLKPDDKIEHLPKHLQTESIEILKSDKKHQILDLKKHSHEIQYLEGVIEIDRYIQDPYERYKFHFETPYFIFVRDMLSYLTLLVLHFAVCVQPTGLRLSVLEWVIMVFFVGRVLLEVDQYVMEESIYISDFWNKLDIATIVIYIVTFICRLVTWSNSSYISHNPLPVATSYLYGINAMLLTWRVFGQTMEVTKSTGTKQIALFKILNAVIVIFMQMLAAMLGFSLVLTKVYVAEVLYDAKANVTSHGICSTSTHGMLCWLHFFEFLTWSIVGLGDPNLLTLENSFSNYTTKLLYLLFLVVAAVIIMNMLIALLSNKYQEIEDNAFQEWSYRKAYMIRTYCLCHPIPVPFCIVSLTINLLKGCWKHFCANKREKEKENKEKEEKKNYRDKILKEFCDRLQRKYYAEHGDSFSQDSSKINQQLRENKWLMGHIADEVFKKDAIKTSSNDWKCSDGIKVEGRQLIRVKCKKCKRAKRYLRCVHGALHQDSLSKEWPGFEVLIQQSGEKRYLGIGVASKDYRLVAFPGRYPNSVGYNIDSGTTFDPGHRRKYDLGQKGEESVSFAGDLIGCLVLFDKQDDGGLPVQFTRNGRVVGEAKLEAKLIGDIHPLISMASSGIHVMFRRIRNVDSDSTKQTSIEKVRRQPQHEAENLQHVVAIKQQEMCDTKLQDVKAMKQLQHDVADVAQKQQEICETVKRQQEMCEQILKYLKNNVHEDNQTEATSEAKHSLKSCLVHEDNHTEATSEGQHRLKSYVHEDNHTEATSEGQHRLKSYV